MVIDVRLYVEGGGDGSESKAAFRRGFGQFLDSLRQESRRHKVRWHIIACGGRNGTFDAFKTALRVHPDACNILVVDAEEAVTQAPWGHLFSRDGWVRPEACTKDQCHLMTQCMEAWLLADPQTLERFYGHGFRRNAIPAHADVEAIDKSTIYLSLRTATATTRKGVYQKVRHGAELLAMVDPSAVRTKAKHCERLFVGITAIIGQGAS